MGVKNGGWVDGYKSAENGHSALKPINATYTRNVAVRGKKTTNTNCLRLPVELQPYY